jgi:hypothetical protein
MGVKFWLQNLHAQFTERSVPVIFSSMLYRDILAQIVNFACNLVRILDCDFIVELLADPNLDKTIVGSADSGLSCNLVCMPSQS